MLLEICPQPVAVASVRALPAEMKRGQNINLVPNVWLLAPLKKAGLSPCLWLAYANEQLVIGSLSSYSKSSGFKIYRLNGASLFRVLGVSNAVYTW